MPFAVPMVCREPKDDVTDCYFCMTNVTGFTAKNKKHISYPNLPSAMRSVLHSDFMVPLSPQFWTIDEDDSESLDDADVEQNDEFLFPV